MHNKHLPRGVTHEHGAYYFRGPDRKRIRLGDTLAGALATFGELVQPDPSAIGTMHDAFERYKRDVLPKRAAKTQRNQGYMFPRVDRVFGKMPPKSIKPPHGYQYLDARSAKPTSALKEFNLVSAVLTQCVKWGVIEANPFLEVDKDGYIPNARERYPTDDEFAAVYALANERLRIFMDLALLTGLRLTGLRGLTLDSATNDGLVVKLPGKKTKPILFTWTRDLSAVVERAQRLEPRVRRALICTMKGTAYTEDGFSANWQRLMRKALEQKALAESFAFRDIRAKSGTDSETDEAAQSLLGHTTVATTRRVYRRKPTKVTPLR